MRRALIAVIGDGTVDDGSVAYALAREVGRRIVDGGQRVLTGGKRGVMEAACRGAHESSRYREGDTVGLLPGPTPAKPTRGSTSRCRPASGTCATGSSPAAPTR